MREPTVSGVAFQKEMGLSAAPSCRKRFAQRRCSKMKGTTTDGFPARNAECVVPAPPWWTTADEHGATRIVPLSPERAFPKRMATFSDEGDKAAGDPPSSGLVVPRFLQGRPGLRWWWPSPLLMRARAAISWER
jgi:hypothetical protein